MVKRPRRVDAWSTQPVYLVKAPKFKEIEAQKKQLKGRKADVYLYPDGQFGEVSLDELAAVVKAACGRETLSRAEYFPYHLERLSFKTRRHELNDRAMRLSWTRVRDRALQDPGMTPWLGEVDYEKTRLGAELHPDFGTLGNYVGKPAGVMYDAAAFQEVCGSILPEEEIEGLHHVIVTNQVLGVWNQAKKHWETVPYQKGNIITIVSAVEREAEGEHPGPRTVVVVDPSGASQSVTYVDKEALKARLRAALAK
ncbi:MAG: hypothetical protein HY330_06830 [Chloroflexi bacterium]|nr:hypothetical protein [Chloroflexota bacterium]